MKAIRLASIVDQLILSLESDMPTDLTPQMIQALVNEWLLNELARWEEHRLNRIIERGGFPLDQEPRNYEVLIQAFEKDVQQARLQEVSGTAQRLLEEKGLEVDKSSKTYTKLCLDLLGARARWIRIEQKRSRGEDYSHDLPQGGSGPLVGTTAKATSSYVTLSEAVEKYIQIKTDSEDWRKSTAIEIPIHLREFVELVEYKAGKGFPIASLDRDTMRDYGSLLTKLPAKRTVFKEYRNKTLAQLEAMDIPNDKRMSPKTIKNKYTNVRTLLTWAEDEGYLPNSGTLKRAIKDPKQVKKPRGPFSREDLAKLFYSSAYTEDKHTKAERYWTPLIALYSGARVSEICQLTVEDFREEEGVWVFDINDNDDKKVKTEAGKRIVPIHPDLIELGLLERVKALRTAKATKLFPKLPKPNMKGNVGDSISKWFGAKDRYRDGCGVEKVDPKEGYSKSFHSFRHTFATEVKRRQLDRRMLKEIVGHEAGLTDDVTDIYEDRYPTSTLFNEVMAKVSFDLDLERLRTTKWIEKA